MLRNREFWIVVLVGALLGGFGVMLAFWGNPRNSGICISCFIETSAGALGLHDNQNMQYLRPELVGFVLGSTLSALLFKEFRSRGGSAPLSRLFLGIFMIFGCAVFIGCPIKLFLRFTAGDLTSLAGVAGLVLGVWVGLKGLSRGAELPKPLKQVWGNGFVLPFFFIILLLFLFVRPDFLLYSVKGSATQHAPGVLALSIGLLLGAMAQKSRFCITGSIRDSLLMGFRIPAIWGLSAFLASAFILSLATGMFCPGMYGQPGAHLEFIWSFLGMGLVGWISVLIGGCPFRQLVKAGEGDADAGMVVIGMFIGGALAQAWGVASTSAGVSLYGKIAVLSGLAFIGLITLQLRERLE